MWARALRQLDIPPIPQSHTVPLIDRGRIEELRATVFIIFSGHHLLGYSDFTTTKHDVGERGRLLRRLRLMRLNGTEEI